MRSGLNRKLVTLATTALSVWAVFSENPATAGSLSFEAKKLDGRLAVMMPSHNLDSMTVQNLSGFTGLNGIIEDYQNMDDSVNVDRFRNSSSYSIDSVNLLHSQSNIQSWTDAEADAENPWFFEAVILSISLMGGLMTLTPMMMMKNDLE